MIKVLMFGWEFPPHISGGLGTACYGLTHALQKARVKVLFAVPKLYGDEPADAAKLIDASTVIKERRKTKKVATGKNVMATEIIPAIPNRQEHVRHETITYIRTPSVLRPYYGPDDISGEFTRELRNWNYSFQQTSHAVKELNTGLVNGNDTMTATEDDGEVFNFTGTYGSNLMEEVARYADVAGTLTTKYSFDVIHAHDWMTYPAGLKAKRMSGKPLVIHVHSTEFDRSGDHISQVVFEIERLGFTEADHIITVSNWTKQVVMTRYGIPAEKITVVHNGIIPKEEPLNFSFPDIGSHFVTFLGRVTHQKGPAFFVEAAEKVLQEFPDAHFIVAGAGDLLPQIIERVARLNMSSNFHFTGFLSGNQVDQIWSLTDVYVMPSVSEPFGIAPLEAIQGGVPVILSKQSGVSEVMPHAIKVDFWDTAVLAGAICSVLRYESLSHVLRQNSKKHIKHLTWEKAAQDVKAVYNELTRKK